MNQIPETDNQTAATPGEWLKQARAKADMPIAQVAKDLNLDIRKIEAIEANRFIELGAPVYAKGYLRKYARLVNVPEAALLNRYETYGGAPAEVVPVPASLGTIPEQRPVLPRWIWWLVLVLIGLAGAASLLSMRSKTNGSAASAVQSQPGVIESTDDQSSPLAALPDNAATSSVAAAPGQVTVGFTFNADSWVEVYDVNNQQVLYEMGAAGGARSVNALPPLRVTLGSAAAVTVQVNARTTVVPADHIDANVARFVVNASGAIE